MATTKNVELAVQVTDDAWELIDDYTTIDEAIQAARDYAEASQGQVPDSWRDADGAIIFGISDDPKSGHYETWVKVYRDGTFVVQ
jgi:hypothetical protein